MSQIWSDPASYTTEQWLAVCILGFIVLAMLVMVHRLLTIFKISRKQPYKPNFRRLRRVTPRTKDREDSQKSSTKDSNNER